MFTPRGLSHSLDMPNPYLFQGLLLSPETVARLVSVAPKEAWDTHRDEKRFTFRESVAHLADWEPIFFDRIRTAVDTPGASIPGYDESVIAEQHGYVDLDPAPEAETFRVRRAALVAYLKALKPDDWSKTAIHSERGEMSVYDWANTIIAHDIFHIEHLCRFL